MQAARVIGTTHATVRHPSLDGWRLLVVLPLDIHESPDGFPALAIDNLGARCGDLVFFTSDGNVVRELVGQNDCPVRFAVQGIMDA
ncbi:MAG: EutN/CcmL family microcompartment protein [Fuerstiella sp.]|nr:EutN/CcmL family microcompartment protein [Fuerstiella sp.]